MPSAGGSCEPRPLARHGRAGKAREVGPGARRPPSDRKAEKPSWKGVAHMHKLLSGLVAGIALLAAAPAGAAPVTVDLRIEGPNRTVFEGPVTTDVRAFRFSGDNTAHRCDGTAASQGTSAGPVPTRGAVIAEASERAPFSLHGDWYDSLGSPSFTEVGGEDMRYDAPTSRYLVEFDNAQAASRGSCGDAVAPGDHVLFAYTDGSEPLLLLTGPSSARPGGAVTLKGPH